MGVVARAGLTTRVMLLALAWLVSVQCAIGCVAGSGGWSSATTLGSGALTLGADAGVCTYTLGIDAGVGAGAGVCMHTFGVDSGVGVGAVRTPLELMQRLELAGCLVGHLWAS
jgi:hypothetical protein